MDDSDIELLRRVAHVSSVPPRTRTLPFSELTEAVGLDPERRAPKPGDVIEGRYAIEMVLGEGGMGVVFAARNLRTGREVALKYMTAKDRGSSSERARRTQRFIREARAAGRVRHDNVVDIYDVAGDADAPYLVMERLHGLPLWERVKQGPLPESEARAVVLQAARGVAALHEQGVVHRDLKPENIFLAQVGDQIVPKVLDFGVSRIVATNEPLATITRDGGVIGTPAYMPIEQLRGEQGVDARSDVYALGVILYEALSARRPFEARTVHELMLRMLEDDLTPLSAHGIRVSAELEAIITRCLAKDPEQRFAHAGELVAALEGRATPVRERRLRSSQRFRTVLLALLGCAVLAWLVQRVAHQLPSSTAGINAAPARAQGRPPARRAPNEPAATLTVEHAPEEHDGAGDFPPGDAVLSPNAPAAAPPVAARRALRQSAPARASMQTGPAKRGEQRRDPLQETGVGSPRRALERARELRPEDF